MHPYFFDCLHSVSKGPLGARPMSGGCPAHEFLYQDLESDSRDIQVPPMADSRELAMRSAPDPVGSHGRKGLTDFQDAGPNGVA